MCHVIIFNSSKILYIYGINGICELSYYISSVLLSASEINFLIKRKLSQLNHLYYNQY